VPDRGGGALRVDETVGLGANAYGTPTGRLLLAHATPDEVELFVAENGLPGAAWPKAPDRGRLERALAAIRQHRGSVVVAGPEIAAAACPVFEGGRAAAALGVYLPAFRFRGPTRTQVMDGLKAAADRIAMDIERQRKGTSS